jgi:hypothetical protein
VELLSAYLANNTVAAQDVPDLIRSTRMALTEAQAATLGGAEASNFSPAVSVRKSLASPEHTLRLGKKASARRLNSDEAAEVVAHSVAEPSAADERSSKTDEKTDEERPAADVKALSDGAKEKGGSKRQSNSSSDTIPTDAASLRTKEPVEENEMPSASNASEPSSDLDAGTSKRRVSVTDGPRRRAKLSLFAGRDVETQVQSHQNGTAVAKAEPRSGTDLGGSSKPSAAPVVASGGRAQMALAPELPRGPDERDNVVVEGTSPRLTLMEAIARKRAVTALYNGAVIKLAPHQIFERHGDLFVTALNLSKNWRADEERRLGQFKLAGLKDVTPLEEAIASLPSYDGKLPRPEDILILSI